jgi:hypothetical protein
MSLFPMAFSSFPTAHRIESAQDSEVDSVFGPDYRNSFRRQQAEWPQTAEAKTASS